MIFTPSVTWISSVNWCWKPRWCIPSPFLQSVTIIVKSEAPLPTFPVRPILSEIRHILSHSGKTMGTWYSGFITRWAYPLVIKTSFSNLIDRQTKCSVTSFQIMPTNATQKCCSNYSSPVGMSFIVPYIDTDFCLKSGLNNVKLIDRFYANQLVVILFLSHTRAWQTKRLSENIPNLKENAFHYKASIKTWYCNWSESLLEQLDHVIK